MEEIISTDANSHDVATLQDELKRAKQEIERLKARELLRVTTERLSSTSLGGVNNDGDDDDSEDSEEEKDNVRSINVEKLKIDSGVDETDMTASETEDDDDVSPDALSGDTGKGDYVSEKQSHEDVPEPPTSPNDTEDDIRIRAARTLIWAESAIRRSQVTPRGATSPGGHGLGSPSPSVRSFSQLSIPDTIDVPNDAPTGRELLEAFEASSAAKSISTNVSDSAIEGLDGDECSRSGVNSLNSPAPSSKTPMGVAGRTLAGSLRNLFESAVGETDEEDCDDSTINSNKKAEQVKYCNAAFLELEKKNASSGILTSLMGSAEKKRSKSLCVTPTKSGQQQGAESPFPNNEELFARDDEGRYCNEAMMKLSKAPSSRSLKVLFK